MTGRLVSHLIAGAMLGCVSSAVIAALLLAAPLAIGGDYAGAMLYAVLFYPWSLIVAFVFGIPAFLLASRFGVANVLTASAYGGVVGAFLGAWIGNWQMEAVASYGAAGVLCGTVFHVVQHFFSRKRGSGTRRET